MHCTAKPSSLAAFCLRPKAQPLRWARPQSAPIEWAGRSVALFEAGPRAARPPAPRELKGSPAADPAPFISPPTPRPLHIAQSIAFGASAPLTNLLTTGAPHGFGNVPRWRSRLLFEWTVGGCTSLSFWTATQRPIASLESQPELRAPPRHRCSSYRFRVSGSDSGWLD